MISRGSQIDEDQWLTDPAITMGISIFETLRVYSGHIYGLDQHLERLQQSAHFFEIPLSPLEEIKECWLQAASYVHTLSDSPSLRYMVSLSGQSALTWRAIDPSYIRSPLRVACAQLPPSLQLPRFTKNSARAEWFLTARALRVDEVILCDRDELLEAHNSNLFVLQGSTLITPPADGRILNGVTRRALMCVAPTLGLRVKEHPIYSNDSWDALYLTSTLKELSWVSHFNGESTPSMPTQTAKIQDALSHYLRNHDLQSAHLTKSSDPLKKSFIRNVCSVNITSNTHRLSLKYIK